MPSYGDVSDFMAGADPDRFKILVPLDGSVHAEGALAYLSALAPVGTLDLHLIAVVDDTEDDDAERLGSQRNLLEAYLRERAERLHDGVGARETIVAQGAPAAAILAEADRTDANLLIISSHSRSGIQRWRLGSVADKVVRSAVCDTLVIGSEVETKEPHIRKVLLPLDGSELAEQALPHAIRMVSKLGAELHLVRVVSFVAMAGAGDPTGMGYTSPELYEAVTEAAEDYIQRVKEQTGASHASTMFGTPAESLLTYSEDHAIDLVVMTSHGRSGILRTALGSVTDRLLGGRSPVLVVRGK